MGYPHSPLHIVLFVLFYVVVGWLVPSIPAFVVGRRTGVPYAGVAFVPVVGPLVVVLHSVRRSGWLCLLALIPIANVVFAIWLAWVVPGEHGRTRWWTLAFLLPGVNLIAFYAYALTFPRPSGPRLAFAAE
jgi:cytochrome bd-type quinol oxidase subunit 2